MNKYSVVKLALVLFFSLTLIACGGKNESGESDKNGSEGDNNAKKEFKFSVSASKDSQIAIGVEAFKEKLEELSDEEMTIKTYYDNALGGEREAVEGLSIDSIDMASVSTGTIGGFVDDFFVFDLPYLFEDREHAYSVLDGEIGDELAEKLKDEANVKVLGYHENGWRQFTNSVRPIEKPEDLDGIKHRTQESEVQIDFWKMLGTDPTSIAWPEVYTALQQGVVQSQDNPLPIIYDSKFYEVQDYVSLTRHIYSPALIMISNELFESLSEEDQQVIQKAADYAVEVQRKGSQKMDEDMMDVLKEKGMEINEPDLDAFKEAVEPVYDKWAPEIGSDLIDRIRNYER